MDPEPAAYRRQFRRSRGGDPYRRSRRYRGGGGGEVVGVESPTILSGAEQLGGRRSSRGSRRWRYSGGRSRRSRQSRQSRRRR